MSIILLILATLASALVLVLFGMVLVLADSRKMALQTLGLGALVLFVIWSMWAAWQ